MGSILTFMILISVRNNTVRYIQVEDSQQRFIVSKIDSFKLPATLKSLDLRSPDLKFMLQEHLFQRIFREFSSSKIEVLLSLDDMWIDNHIYEVDSNLELEEKGIFLNWVHRQREGDLWHDKMLFYQNLTTGEDQKDRILSCATYKNVVDSFKEALENFGGIPVWLESSLSSLSNVVSFLNTGKTAKILLVEPSGKKFNGYFYNNSELSSIAILNITGQEIVPTNVKGDLEFINQCLQDLMSCWKDINSTPELRIFLAGEYTDTQLQRWIRDNNTMNFVTIISPFSEMACEDVEVPDCSQGSWFVDHFGLMIRRI
ncbi:MAG: hypothetical protein ISR95_02210 [Candidatus Marinimicrobia bacterium]|nr:hypothetical protein [Candidatus Neomarinimicrobiota bacterium]